MVVVVMVLLIHYLCPVHGFQVKVAVVVLLMGQVSVWHLLVVVQRQRLGVEEVWLRWVLYKVHSTAAYFAATLMMEFLLIWA